MGEAASEFLGECPSEEIGAYLDAELTAERSAALEGHFAICAICREELNAQKAFMLELNRSLEDEGRLELPENFTRAIVTKAESGVTGLRKRSERMAAVGIVTLLLLLAAIGFAGDWGRLTSEAAKPILTVGAVADAAAGIFSNLIYAVGFIMKKIFAGSAGTLLLGVALALGTAAIFLVLRRRRPADGY